MLEKKTRDQLIQNVARYSAILLKMAPLTRVFGTIAFCKDMTMPSFEKPAKKPDQAKKEQQQPAKGKKEQAKKAAAPAEKPAKETPAAETPTTEEAKAE